MLRKYWWLVLLIIIVLIFKIFPDKLPFLEKIDGNNTSAPKYDAGSATHDPLTEISKLNIDESSLSGFIPVVPIKYHVNAYKEISVPDGDSLEPRVSPNGMKILFVLMDGSRSWLAIADLTSGKIAPITVDFDNVRNPSWNVDGTQIVFVGAKGQQQEIYTYHLESKKLFQVTKATQRKPAWPRLSPYTFDGHFRIVYVSEEGGRKDLWWIRDNGEDDRPITIPPDRVQEFMIPEKWKMYDGGIPAKYSLIGGDFPEWSPNGEMIVYKAQNGSNLLLHYSWIEWWQPAEKIGGRSMKMPLPSTKGYLMWSPNQSSYISYDPASKSSSFIPGDASGPRNIAGNKSVTSTPAIFPDGKGITYSYNKAGKSVLAIEPLDDPLGDVANLWLYEFHPSDWNKLATHHLQFKNTANEQIYSLYESELYQPCDVPAGSDHRRPYLVTSDAVLETFYSAFSALVGYVERVEIKSSITEFSIKGLDVSRKKKGPEGNRTFFSHRSYPNSA